MAPFTLPRLPESSRLLAALVGLLLHLRRGRQRCRSVGGLVLEVEKVLKSGCLLAMTELLFFLNNVAATVGSAVAAVRFRRRLNPRRPFLVV